MMPTGENPDDLAFVLAELRNYQSKTGVQVKAMGSYDGVDTRLMLLQDIFRKKSLEPDIFGIDNIWPGLLADDLIDLKPYLGDEMTAIDKGLLDAFTVDGKLVALPETQEIALLYYRTDLLKRYGYKQPPQTWDELGRMAKVIQDGERKRGEREFWGYIWQGTEGESLNCNAMEWQRAEGANLIENSGAICASSPAAELAVRRARSWIGTISPPSVVEYDEEDASNFWLTGSAAFARGWPSLYALSKASPVLATKFSTGPLPSGRKGYAWTFGGMGLAVSKYSANPRGAADLVRYLVSPDVQRRRLLATASVPSRTSLLRERNLLQDSAFSGWLGQNLQVGMYARPSALTGKKYEAVSRAYSKAVHDALTGKQDSHQSLGQLQAKLVSILQPPGPSIQCSPASMNHHREVAAAR